MLFDSCRTDDEPRESNPSGFSEQNIIEGVSCTSWTRRNGARHVTEWKPSCMPVSLQIKILHSFVSTQVESLFQNSNRNNSRQDDVCQSKKKQRWKLPRTGGFASNHIHINRERMVLRIPPLKRIGELDEAARAHAARMAQHNRVEHSDSLSLGDSISMPYTRLGENISCGTHILKIHNTLMNSAADRNNILDHRYKYMGFGTARGEKGKLYFCQLFVG
mmetsp:Transcript_21570/g.28400  ORF Transcript_21570/g.28400 Transcript_21570/m.28400 type:complete len:219 (+) Transcript_21570:90-746(+)